MNQKILEAGNTISPGFIILGHEMAHKFSINLGIRNRYWFGDSGDERGVDEYNGMYYENVLRVLHGLPRRFAYEEVNGVVNGRILNKDGSTAEPPVGLSSQNMSWRKYEVWLLGF